jgi:hypothetical protein
MPARPIRGLRTRHRHSLAARHPQRDCDGGIQPAHRDNSSATLIASAYPEARSPANVTLYQRHGFEVRGHRANGVTTTPRFDAGLDVTLQRAWITGHTGITPQAMAV